MSEEILAGRNSVTEALRSGRSINKQFRRGFGIGKRER